VLGIVPRAVILTSDTDPGLAIVAEREAIDSLRFVATVAGCVDNIEILARKDDRETAIVGSGTQLCVLVSIVEIKRVFIHSNTDERRLEILGSGNVVATFVMPEIGGRTGGQDKFRLKTCGCQHRVQQDRAISDMTVAVGESYVGGGKLAERNSVKDGPATRMNFAT